MPTSISTVARLDGDRAIWVIALFLVLGELGIDLAPLIAGAGIAGVALGFGAQSLVKDCLTGVFMLLEDQYGIGDVVDLGEATGVVEQISLRTTVLRGGDGTVWHVPNGEVRARRQPLAAVVDGRPRRRRRLRRRPRRGRGSSMRRRPACREPRTTPATCWRRPSCSASRRWRPAGFSLRLAREDGARRAVPAAACAARGDPLAFVVAGVAACRRHPVPPHAVTPDLSRRPS